MMVRPARSADRMRRVTRSTSAAVMPSSSACVRGRRPSACWEPIERRRRRACTGRGSKLWASECRCRPDALPSIATSSVSSNVATSPTVPMPLARSLFDVTGPTPHSRSIGRGCRKSSSRSGSTCNSPSGLATPLATLARNFVRATPTVIGRPTSRITFSRRRRAICTGVPETRAKPETSRNASSIDSASTSGVVSSKTSNTARLASEYASVSRRRRSGRGTTGAPPVRSSPSARRTPWPRSSRRARHRRRRRRVFRAGAGRRAARPTRRSCRGRRGGSRRDRPWTRTHVRLAVRHAQGTNRTGVRGRSAHV